MNGNEYSEWVARYIVANFGDRNIQVYREVNVGKSIIGKNRRVDILIVDEVSNKAVSIECKYQATTGTADEKLPYTLNDTRAMQMDAYVVYGGNGFSKGVVHMLEASELACRSEPGDGEVTNFARTRDTQELDQILAMRFGWWDVFTTGKNPIELQTEMPL